MQYVMWSKLYRTDKNTYMKKLLLPLILFFGTVSGQMKVGEYHLSAYGKSYPIEVNDKRFILVEVPTADKLSDKVVLHISPTKARIFKEEMEEAKQKYIEWLKVADANNVSNVKKKIKVNLQSDVLFQYSKNQLATNVTIEPYFLVNDHGKSLVFTNKYELVSRSNQFIKSDGFLLIFSDPGEVDEFLSQLDIPKAERLYLENKSNRKLLK